MIQTFPYSHRCNFPLHVLHTMLVREIYWIPTFVVLRRYRIQHLFPFMGILFCIYFVNCYRWSKTTKNMLHAPFKYPACLTLCLCVQSIFLLKRLLAFVSPCNACTIFNIYPGIFTRTLHWVKCGDIFSACKYLRIYCEEEGVNKPCICSQLVTSWMSVFYPIQTWL